MAQPRAAERRLQELKRALVGKRRLLILTHDNPDPDCIASAWGLQRVIRELRRLRVEIAYGGIIGRSENRTLREVLRVPLRPLSGLDLSAFDAFALVDSQPETGNNSLPSGVRPTVVIDHHPCRKPTRQVPFFDVREDYGATATIVSEYLLASGAPVDRRIATAFFYAIKSETLNLGRESSRADVRAFLHFFPLVDNQALSSIENPPLSRAYFSMMDQAIDGTRLHGPVAITLLGRVSNPDVVAEFADLIVRTEKIEWALTIGRYGSDLLLSIRTTHPHANAGQVIQHIVGREGKAGGHGMMAGGKLPAAAVSDSRARALERELKRRTLRILRADQRGTPLVPARSRARG